MYDLVKRTLKRVAPGAVRCARRARGGARALYCRVTPRPGESYSCPICGYRGRFLSFGAGACEIRRTQCPRCELYERHRLQYLVLMELRKRFDFSRMSILHYAPEDAFSRLFDALFLRHDTADIAEEGVDLRLDISRMAVADGSYDVVWASHVLEHVPEDARALAEVRRVLRPGGLAVLPVPVVSDVTVEYGAPNRLEYGHVRAVGPDYFRKYEACFPKVEVWKSSDFADRYQLYTYEDRTCYPTDGSPLRRPVPGGRHLDYVPVCFT